MIITLPFKTPTINHLYWHRGNVKVMKKKAKELRDEIIEIIEDLDCNIENDVELKVIVKVYERWYNIDGSIKKKDIQNREKFLIDSVFKALDIDDKNIFDCRFIKVNSDEDKIIIDINKINNNSES